MNLEPTYNRMFPVLQQDRDSLEEKPIPSFPPIDKAFNTRVRERHQELALLLGQILPASIYIPNTAAVAWDLSFIGTPHMHQTNDFFTRDGDIPTHNDSVVS